MWRHLRLKRLRFAAKQISILTAEFTEAARMRRKRVFQRMAADPNLRVFPASRDEGTLRCAGPRF
jgi:hypothetical protein